MDIRKPRSKKLGKQPLKDITNNTAKKGKSRKSSKNHSKGSSGGKSELSETQAGSVQKSREFYINVKENQLFSLFSAVKLNIENLKCRYKFIQKSQKSCLSKKGILSKIIRTTPLPEQRANDLSPISLSESQYSGSSLMTMLDSKSSSTRTCIFELDRRLKSIELETEKVIEKECKVIEHKRKIAKNKSKVVVALGILYEKKMIIKQEEKNIRKLEQKNVQLSRSIVALKETINNQGIKKDNRTFAKYQNVHTQSIVKNVEERVQDRRRSVRELQSQLDDATQTVSEREKYLRELLELKQKITLRADKMKEFNHCFSSTKFAVLRSMNNASIPRVRSSFK